MKMPTKSNIISIAVIAIFAVAATLSYFYFAGGGQPQVQPAALGQDLTLTVSGETQFTADQLVRLVDELDRMRLDTDVVASPVFQSLSDISVLIAEEARGVTNPFRLEDIQ